MANYGKTTIGGTNQTASANTKYFCKFTSPADIGAVDSISAYLDRSATGGGYAVDGAIYTDNAGVPNALVTNSPIEISSNIARNSPNWYSISYTTKPTLSPNTVYWLGVLTTKASFYYYDAGTVNQRAARADTLPFDDPFGVSPGWANQEISVYVSYTPTGQTFYQNTGQASVSISSALTRVGTFARAVGVASVTIAGEAVGQLIGATQQAVGGAVMKITGGLLDKCRTITSKTIKLIWQ